jgi:hypothetical protein
LIHVPQKIAASNELLVLEEIPAERILSLLEIKWYHNRILIKISSFFLKNPHLSKIQEKTNKP